MGYEVWADVLGFKGGDDRPRKLEHALRHRTCKMLLVADKQGVRNEIQMASDVARTIGDPAFITRSAWSRSRRPSSLRTRSASTSGASGHKD